MDGTDNQNISQKELLEFIREVHKGNVICPVCKKNMLKLDNIQEHVPDFETYIRGIGYFVTTEISCPCGFKNHFNSDWCRKGFDGTEKQIHRVGLAVGGVMEKPDITYEKVEEIEAYSRKDAIEKYKEKHPRLAKGYWSVSVVPDRY